MSRALDVLRLEQWLLDELTPALRVEVEAAIELDPGLKKRLDELQRSNTEILSTHPSSALSDRLQQRVRERAGGPSRIQRSREFALVTSLGIASLVAMLSLSSREKNLEPVLEATRIKGMDSTLRVFRKTATGSEMLNSGKRASRGDLVRLGYQTQTQRYGMIVSIDGRDAVTRHWPSQGSMSAPLQSGGLVLLDEAFELDDAPGFERFYLVTSTQAFSADIVLSAMKSGRTVGSTHPLALPPGFEQMSIELEKEISR